MAGLNPQERDKLLAYLLGYLSGHGLLSQALGSAESAGYAVPESFYRATP